MFGFGLALSAGMCAALASVFAKLAMSPQIWERILCFGLSTQCEQIVIAARVISFLLVFVTNAVMWTLFVKAMRKCSSSLEATIINTAANFIFSAVLGKVIFGEVLSLSRWFCGVSLILLGLMLIHYSTNSQETEQTQSQETHKKDS